MLNEKEERLLKLSEEFQIGKGINSDEHIRMLSQIESYPRNEVVEIFNFFAAKEINPQVLFYIVKVLGKFNDKSSAGVLADILLLKGDKYDLKSSDEHLKIRCAIATILGNIKDNASVFPLLYILNNKGENYKLRLGVAEALGRIGDKYAVTPLIDLVTDEEEKSVYLRESAAKALGMLGDMRAVDPLVNILETKKGIIDKFTFLKERIIEAIGRLGFQDDRTIKALSNSLIDESSSIRLGAVEALSEINDKRVIPLIEKMLFDEEEDVARGAVIASYNVLGKDYIIELLKRDDLAGWCKDEIETLLEEADEEELDECE